MPNRIQILDDHLINKIAAGEVIENAASVVKELVENAIDAASSFVEVTTKGGGRVLIQVSDNGSGIEKGDLPLALFRHATSKIVRFEDLFSLHSFGFRGEALASIAAVSRIQISSSLNEMGHKILAEGGKILEEGVVSRKKGTTIEVRDLFFNLPVRKKFQKSLTLEVREIERVLLQVALTYPKVHLKWINDGKEEVNLFSDRDLLQTIVSFFGKEWGENLLSLSCEKEGFSAFGYIGKPHFTRSNKTGQHVFVNNRPIHSTLISEAVLEGYATRIAASKFPHFVIFITVDPQSIDVNVHPQKKEVRFQDEKALFSFLKEGVEKTLIKQYEPVITTQKFELKPSPFVLTTMPLKTAPVSEKKRVAYSLVAIIEGYLIMDKEGEYFLVSTFNAQKRVLLEKIEQKKCGSVQSLLFPVTIELNRDEKRALEGHQELLDALHISMRDLGDNCYIIDAMPEGMDEEKIKTLLNDPQLEKKDLEKKVRISLNHLCKKRKFSFGEASALIETLFTCEQPHVCPEGRPTFIPWPKEEIKRLFV